MINNNVFVSVIVPNYNHARFLRKRIDSILNQTYQNFELIILDDNSNDDSVSVIEEYRSCSSISHIVYNNINSGSTFKQWEKGLSLAKGDWIWIAESDDMCSSLFLQDLTTVISLDQNLSFVYCKTMLIDEYDNNKGIHNWGEEIDLNHWKQNFTVDGSSEMQKYLWQRNFIPNASAVLFNKYKALSVINSITSLKYSGDWFFWALMMKNSKISYCATTLNYFRRYSEATSLINNKAGILNRSKENMYVINQIQSIDDTIILNPYKHKWMIKEWERHKDVLNILEYIWPPFYFSLKMYFWKRYFYSTITHLRKLFISK